MLKINYIRNCTNPNSFTVYYTLMEGLCALATVHLKRCLVAVLSISFLQYSAGAHAPKTVQTEVCLARNATVYTTVITVIYLLISIYYICTSLLDNCTVQ